MTASTGDRQDPARSTGGPSGNTTDSRDVGRIDSASTEAALESAEAEISTLWRRARALSYHLAREVHFDLDPAAYGLLAMINRTGPLRLTDLAASIGVGKPSVSRQVSFLESIELVRKVNDPLDGRAQLITLTDEGRSRLEAALVARKEALHARLAQWSPADISEFARLLAKFNGPYDAGAEA
ncbi:MarR family winged helix-turn-helix transcriptional regulator [Psychromicrobium xiongbiense]|uniref:MarR family winged helix-turn-helix transcriptional regulator n=1 Tax=Psychromicrobium xiongbiense TaxID=3051184 RepID=UPI002553E2AC|nr:MarR family transcriptional regulator [Psychromicrobium sp. YIM S02556]